MERGELARWAARLGPGWEVIPRTRFGRRYDLAAIFRGLGRPDMIAVHNSRRRVLVGDVTAQPDAAHLAKTVAYARRLAGELPAPLSGYRVLAQDWYWALPPEYGRRSWPTSRRIIVPAPARATEAAMEAALPELSEGFAWWRPRRPRAPAPVRGDRAIRAAPTVVGPYAHLADRTVVAPYKRFTVPQKRRIYRANRDRNGGVLMSDDPADPYSILVASEQSVSAGMGGRGQPPNMASVDHIVPRSAGGTNSYANARVVSVTHNRDERDKRGR